MTAPEEAKTRYRFMKPLGEVKRAKEKRRRNMAKRRNAAGWLVTVQLCKSLSGGWNFPVVACPVENLRLTEKLGAWVCP